jgi:hypothetical protein
MGASQAQALAPYAACGEGRNHTVEELDGAEIRRTFYFLSRQIGLAG